jgi:hypothetical protein
MIVWIDKLPSDTRTAVRRATASIIENAQIHHFHDQNKVAGREIAYSIGAPGEVAWDVYLLYVKGTRWEDRLPVPAEWAHQLTTATWANPARYHAGKALTNKLCHALSDLCF